jgi:hypothetical protein
MTRELLGCAEGFCFMHKKDPLESIERVFVHVLNSKTYVFDQIGKWLVSV